MFVDENIHSGLAVASGHRQSLHELILGAQAVSLNRQLQQLVARVEEHNAVLRERGSAIPTAERGPYSIDDFCALAARPDIEEVINASERNLVAIREQEPVRTTPIFETLSLPTFDIEPIERILSESLPTLDTAAAARVQAHLQRLGNGGEAWVAEGMRHIPQPPAGRPILDCPFCSQSLDGSPVLSHYRAYFGAGYRDLKRRISDSIENLDRMHANDRPASFERSIRVAIERRQFWARFTDLPEITVDTATIVRDWRIAREAIRTALITKQSAPLEAATLPGAARAAVANYEVHRQTISGLNIALRTANGSIRVIQERTATGNAAAISSDLARFRAVRARYTPATAALCSEYLAEKSAKALTEQQRDTTRATLDTLRATVFSGCQTAVNLYLQRFAAGFRLDSIVSANTRGGLTCTYNVVINNTPVAIGVDVQPGRPSFRNTLSAGDRNTLALAFFFASLDQDPGLANKIIVIDDPVSSLDDHRSLTTKQEIRRLAERTAQVIVLSHNKPFLYRIWENADRTARAALQVLRDGTGSTIQAWNVDQDCLTEHDRRHAILREYLNNRTPNAREVAAFIRPILEAFLRVASPEYFVPGTMLGHFINVCRQRLGLPEQILSQQEIQELSDLVEYGNQFHHDTNAAWETTAINDAELEMFVRRALTFTSA